MKGMIAMTKREKNLVPLFEERRDTTSGIQKYNKILIFVPIIVILIAILSIVVVAKTDESTLGIKVSDKDTNINLENAKFTVKKVVNGEEEDAKDVEGNFVGSVENIDGNDYRIVSTNSNGEINLSLPSGTYKVTQISAPEGYELNEENTYEVTLTSNGTYNLNYLNKEWEKNFEKDVLSSDIKATQGEEYLSLILSRKNTNIPAEETSFNSEVLLEENKAYIFRYNKDNKISEVVNLKLDEQSGNFINDLKEDNTKSNKVRNDSGMITIKIVKETDNYYIIRGGDSYIWFDKTGNLLKYLRLYPEGSYISADTDSIETNDGFITYIDTIYELKEGTLNGKQILQKLSDENNMTKWIFRLMGTLFIMGGFAAIISPLQRLANFIPFFGTVFGWVTGFATFILGLALSLIVIALAWLRYRPVLLIGLLIGVLIVIILTKKLKTKNNTNKKEINTQPVNIQNTSTDQLPS